VSEQHPPAAATAALLIEALPYIRRFAGCVVVVVGRWGSSRPKGTFEADIVLGELWVGMAQPAATKATRTAASAA